MREGGPWVMALLFTERAKHTDGAGWMIGPTVDSLYINDALRKRGKLQIGLAVLLYTGQSVGGSEVTVRITSDARPPMEIASSIKEFNGRDQHLALVRLVTLPVSGREELFIAEVLVGETVMARSPLSLEIDRDHLGTR